MIYLNNQNDALQRKSVGFVTDFLYVFIVSLNLFIFPLHICWDFQSVCNGRFISRFCYLSINPRQTFIACILSDDSFYGECLCENFAKIKKI